MLSLELVALLEHDAAKYPIVSGKSDKADKKAAKGGRAAVPQLQTFSDDELKAAAAVLEGEVVYVIKAMDHSSVAQVGRGWCRQLRWRYSR